MSTDWRSMFDRDYIGAWDLAGRDVVVTIAAVKAGELGRGNKKERKPVVFFDGKEKGFALNKTNAKTIAGMYGNDTAKWIGRRITIYPSQTMFGSEQVDCIRVRPTPPKGRPAAQTSEQAAPPPPPPEEASHEDDALEEESHG